MARQLYTAAEAAELVIGRDVNYISSSEVSEIDEDDDFPFPRSGSDDGFSSHYNGRDQQAITQCAYIDIYCAKHYTVLFYCSVNAGMQGSELRK